MEWLKVAFLLATTLTAFNGSVCFYLDFTQKFTYGSCNTTVVVEETLIFAVLKDFGLHKKVAQIFFER